MVGAACANFRQVFMAPGRVFFVDADCYARMTRVLAIGEHPGLVLKWHEFENAPFGTRPHTTVPLDYSVVFLRALLTPFYGSSALDFAGAWVSPLLGWLALVAVWRGLRDARWPCRVFGLLVFAASPILAHGFELGRPDHQSLVLACTAWALVAEWELWKHSTQAWGVVSGVAWALGLWTSLYEPAILLSLSLVAALIWNRAIFRQRQRLPGLILGGLILLLALKLEGWRISAVPGFGTEAGANYFAAWSHQIGELGSLSPWSTTLYAWAGLGLLLSPFLLAVSPRENWPSSRAQLLILAAVFLLTCWQIRWGYFLPLAYVLSLPSQFGALPDRWRSTAWVFLVAGLWPMFREWKTRLWPPPELQASFAEQRTDVSLLRDAAQFIAEAAPPNPAPGDPPFRTILAPWWLSPPLAYWSRQPAVAGSSHEALAGTVEVARFFMATEARQAAEILRHRRVRWVVAYEPARVQSTSAALLGLNPPPSRFLELALYEKPEVVPRYLHLVFVNQYFKIYEVQVGLLPHA